MTEAAALQEIEPLVRLSDLDEYRQGLDRRLSGEWNDETWTGFRVRFGVYGQKQPGVQMLRIKIPGGVVPLDWLTTLASFNREFCKGDVHITTRQDFQTYFVPLERTGEALEFLYSRGMTTREACGNTLRNVSACALSGRCPREHVDAGRVAETIALSWLRQPLVQHMPRKAKISVSGCATDCAAAPIHDLGFVAVEKDGRKGFEVHVAGGLGGVPRPAIRILDFVTEEEVPTVVETTARIHQRYSDRVNRAAARIKFVAKRFGDEKFKAVWIEEFERLKGLPQRPWPKQAWRTPDEAAIERTPMGLVPQHDGKVAIVANPVLGNLSADQLDALVLLGREFGFREVRATRDQNLMIPDIAPERVADLLGRLEDLNIPVPASAADSTDVVSCPGTTTCRIGITNSPGLAQAVLADSANDPTAKGIAVRISGCQNSCGQHHIGDFGFHGMAKKVDGAAAPHYQIHIGGDGRAGRTQAEMVGMSGPIVAARHAPEALRILRQAYAGGRLDGESVRGWADRLGKNGIVALLAPLEAVLPENVFTDLGDDELFKGAPTVRGECAAPFASDDLLADLADDGLITLDRMLAVGRYGEAVESGLVALTYAARRLLHQAGQFTKDEESPEAIFGRAETALRPEFLVPLSEARARVSAEATGLPAFREAVAVFVDTARAALSPEEAERDAAE